MTRALPLICFAVLFHSISTIPLDDENYHDEKANARNIEQAETRQNHGAESLKSYHDVASTTIVSRDRRGSLTDLVAVPHPLPTRHGKHRRRRRCKNRPTCSLVVTSSRQRFSSRNYDDANESNDSYPTLRSVKDILIAREHVVSSLSSFEKAEITERSTIAGSRTLSKDNEKSMLLGSSKHEMDIYDESDFEDVDVSSWSNTKSSSSEMAVNKSDRADIYDAPLSFISASLDSHFPFHGSLATLLTRLFQTLRNVSAEDSRDILKELNFIANTDEDPCQKWLNSWDKFEQAFLGSLVGLPACPCQYPSDIFYDDKIWDEEQRKYFRWRDVSGESQRLDVYKPGAAYCVRSLLAQGSGSAAAQHCCYDHKRRLLTRGSGAGTPNFISPEISALLHERIDVLPWRLCKGDFSRFNKVRPPNNDNGCETNPDDEEYQRQIDNTKYY